MIIYIDIQLIGRIIGEVYVQFKFVERAQLADVVQAVDVVWCDGCAASGKSINYPGLQPHISTIELITNSDKVISFLAY